MEKTTGAEHFEDEDLEDVWNTNPKGDEWKNKPLPFAQARSRLITVLEDGSRSMAGIQAAVEEIGPHLDKLRPEIYIAQGEVYLRIHDTWRHKLYVFGAEPTKPTGNGAKELAEANLWTLQCASAVGVDEETIANALQPEIERLDAEGDWNTLSGLMSGLTKTPSLLRGGKLGELRIYRLERADPKTAAEWSAAVRTAAAAPETRE